MLRLQDFIMKNITEKKNNDNTSYPFYSYLALLDYVSRAHEIEIRPSSIVRPSVCLWHRLSLKLLHGFLQILVVASPGHMPRRFFHFWQKFILTFYEFVFVNMWLYGSQNFKTLLLPQITFESFQTFSEICSQWSCVIQFMWSLSSILSSRAPSPWASCFSSALVYNGRFSSYGPIWRKVSQMNAKWP